MGEGDVKGVDVDNVTVSSGPSSVNVYNTDRRIHRTLEDRVEDLERMIYGEPKWSEIGLIKRQQRQLLLSQINVVINAIMLLLLVSYLFWIR
jgi:hypothetical protein